MAARRRLLAEAPPGDHHKRGAPPPEWTEGYLNGWLSQPTRVFGLHLWVLIGIAVGAAIVLVLLLIFICLSRRRRRREDLAGSLYPSDTKLLKQHMQQQQATPTKDIPEIVRRQQQQTPPPAAQLAKAEQTPPTPPPQQQRAQVPVVPTLPTRKTPGSTMSATTSGGSERGVGTPRSAAAGPEVSHLGWGHWFTLRDLEEATDGLAEENVIGEGGYGIVYRGTLQNATTIAVKNLLNNR
jgi:hypothetical protein